MLVVYLILVLARLLKLVVLVVVLVKKLVAKELKLTTNYQKYLIGEKNYLIFGPKNLI